jgi:hypothetical protein
MGISNPSRPKGKAAALKAARPGASQAFWISVEARDDAPPFLDGKGSASAPTLLGAAVFTAWRNLGEGRPALVTDAFALGSHSFQGILRIKPGPDSPTLSTALRLFKALSARALSVPEADAGFPGASALWKRGYREKALTTLKQVVDARAAVKKAAVGT